MAKHDKYATLRVKNKRARCAGSRAGTETACPGCAGTVESGLCRLVPAHSGVPAHTSNSRFQQLACVHGPRGSPALKNTTTRVEIKLKSYRPGVKILP